MKRYAEVAQVEPVERSSDTYTALFATGFFEYFQVFFLMSRRFSVREGKSAKVRDRYDVCSRRLTWCSDIYDVRLKL